MALRKTAPCLSMWSGVTKGRACHGNCHVMLQTAGSARHRVESSGATCATAAALMTSGRMWPAGGDAFISLCLWQAGYAITDPGLGLFHPSLQVRHYPARLHPSPLALCQAWVRSEA